MGNYYPKLRHIATGGGALSMALVGYANVDKLLDGGLDWQKPAVITAGALAALGAVAIAAAIRARAQGRGRYAALLLLAVVASEATGFYNTFEGLLHGREIRAEATRTHNASVAAAQAAENTANAEVVRLSQEVTRETKDKGCKSICRGLKEQLEAAKVDAQAKAEAARKAGTIRAENIVAATLNVPEVVAEAAPTLLGAYALLAFSILLPMFGHGREALATERPAAASEDAAVTEVVRRVLAALEKGEASNDELARRLGVPKGTASKWASAAEDAGAIHKHRDGRKVRLVRVA
jgi:hypothetical protein